MNKLHDALEACMTDMENGADLEETLAKYPDYADELRPILLVSLDARKLAIPAPSAEVMRRNRVKLLHRAAQLREEKQQSNRGLFSSQSRWAVVFVLLMLTFFSSSNIVRASTTALPGDGLYSTKRLWEQVRLSFTFDENEQVALSDEFDNERLRETQELLAQGLSEEVEFVGGVMRQKGDEWTIADIPVLVTSETEFPDGPIHVGLWVKVHGITQGDQIVLAKEIEILAGGPAVPEIAPTAVSLTTPMPTATGPTSSISTKTPTSAITPTPSPTVTLTSTATISGSQNVNQNNNDNQNGNDNQNSGSDDNGNGGGNGNDDDNNNNGDDNNNNGNGNGNG